MTVPDQTPQNVHTANGATTTFAYQFKILDTDHLEVYLDDVLQTSGYTVTGEGVNAGGTVVFTTAPANGTEVILMRSMTIERTAYDYQNAGDFLAATVNEDFDAAIMIAQQINNTLTQRALLFPKTLDRTNNTNALPEPETGRVLYWDENGEIQNALISSLATNPTFASELRTFDTMAQAIADATLEETNVLLVAGRGNSYWDLSSSGTANGFNVIYLTASGLYATLRVTHGVELVACGAVDGQVSNDPIQAAIDLAIAEGTFCLDSTGGTFLLNRGTTGVQGADPDDLVYNALTARSNMTIIGVPYQTRFKIADNQSSNGSTYNVPTLFSVEALENIYLYGIEFDGNQANNDLNEVAHGWTQFGFSGSPTASSIAKGDNVHIEMCRFLNNPGATNIGMSQSENTSGTVGKKWRIKNCDFYYNGYKCHDHSSIYGFADDVEITGCDFDNPDMFGTSTLSGVAVGGTVAYELHGADHHFHHNRINNYDQVCWIATNKISPSINGRIHNNTSRTRDTGYGFYRESVNETVIRDMEVYNNTIELTDDATAMDLKAAFRVSSAYKIESVRFYNNNVIKEGTNENACMAAIGSATVASNKHTDIIIDDNDCKGTCYGTYISTNATNGLGRIHHTNNRIKDLADTAAFTETAGIIVNLVGTNTIDSLTLGGNDYKGTAGEPFDRGTYLYAGTITDLHYRGDSHEQMAIANYEEVLTGGTPVTITNKHGDFPTLSYTPVWKAGSSTVTVGNGTNSGYYTKKKDQCTVVAKLVFGTTTAFTGSGTINFSLPITAATAGIKYLGDFTVIDSGTTRYQGQVVIDGTGTVASFERDGGTFLTDTSPIALANTDELYVNVTYRVAD